MLIYKIHSRTANAISFVCDTQATIDAIPVDSTTNKPVVSPSRCMVGTQTDAETLLANNQQALLDAFESQFICNLQTVVEGGTKWEVVNLATEEPNTDKEYFVFDPATGQYNDAIGLEPAKTLLAQTKQNFILFNGLGNYVIMTEWTPPN